MTLYNEQKNWLLPVVLIVVGCLGGCSTENVKRGMYEGLTINPIQTSPHDRVIKPDRLNYSDYERLRKERSE